jgi:hypothetical protein
MEPQDFDELVLDDVLHPGMTASDLRTATEKSSENEESAEFTITIDGSALGRGEQIQLYRQVKDVADIYGATISAPPFAELEHEDNG